jgi:hypothetical protein
MAAYERTGPRATGAHWERRGSRCGEPANRMRSVAEPDQDEGAQWCRRAWGRELTRRETEDSAPPCATAGEQESFRRGQVEALLMEELDTLRQMLSEYLRGDTEKLTTQLDRLRRMLLEYLRSEGQEGDRIGDRTQSQTRRAGEQGAEP